MVATISSMNDQPLRVVGYARVSTEEQAASDAGMEAQRQAIRAEVRRRRWTMVDLYEDAGLSGKAVVNRPALASALAVLRGHQAEALMVAKLDRLSRSMTYAVSLLRQSTDEGWRLVALDLAVDTTTPQGEMMAHVMASFAQFERRLISQRTKSALAVQRAAGVTLGRPRSLPAEVVGRICSLRERGSTLRAIAETLNAERIPTAQGGKAWYPATIRAVVGSAARTSQQGITRRA